MLLACLSKGTAQTALF